MAAVAREVGVNALVNMSQMTVSQMSIQHTTPSPQQRQQSQQTGKGAGCGCGTFISWAGLAS